MSEEGGGELARLAADSGPAGSGSAGDVQAHAHELLRTRGCHRRRWNASTNRWRCCSGPCRGSRPTRTAWCRSWPGLGGAEHLGRAGRQAQPEQRQGRGLGVEDVAGDQLSAADQQALEEVYRQQRELVSWQVGDRGSPAVEGVPGRSPDRVQLVRAGLADAWPSWRARGRRPDFGHGPGPRRRCRQNVTPSNRWDRRLW